jgi:hypothetical protein
MPEIETENAEQLAAPEVPAWAADAGPITLSPDTARRRRRRERVPGPLRGLYDYVVVPAQVPEEHTGSLADVHRELAVGAEGDGARVLAEAQAYFDEAAGRIESAERRATTLQGSVAIAAGLVTAGAGLLLDSSKVPDRAWRVVLVAALALFLVCLIGCGVRALSVTGRVFEYLMPGHERIAGRAALPGEQADLWRAAELLRAGAVSSEIGMVKVGLLSSAAWWFARAILALALLAGLLVAEAVAGPAPQTGSSADRQPTVTRATVRVAPVTVTAPVQTVTVVRSRQGK